MKFLIFINIVTFFLENLNYQHYTDENKISISFENGEVYDVTLCRGTHRILAKYEKQKELINSKFHYETRNNEGNHKLVNKTENNNTYEQLKRAQPNNMKAYLNNYKYRHSKKRGLKKLDCYYEKKLFNSIDKIEKLGKQKNYSNRQIKKIIYIKYGLPLIILCLIPLFGLILPIKFFKTSHLDRTITSCKKIYTGKTGGPKTYIGTIHKDCKLLPPEYRFFNYLFFTSLGLIIILLIIYTYVKILKYKRIKSGMQK